MNPNETFALMLTAIMEGDGHEAETAAGHLADYIKRGGTVPQALTDAYVATHPNGNNKSTP